MNSLARMFCWWPGMDAEIETQVRQCPECQKIDWSTTSAPSLLPLWQCTTLGTVVYTLCRTVFEAHVFDCGRRTLEMD